jgi:hypothetical protein
VKVICVLGLALLASACGGAADTLQEGPTTQALELTRYEIPEARISVSYPSDWLRADERLMPTLADPRELVAVSTFDARRGGDNCAHMPENAIEGMGPTDALVVLEERLAHFEVGSAPADYPARPERFGPANGYPSEAVDCLDRPKEFFDRFIPFRDSGRRFYAYIAFGTETPPATRAEAWSILDQLEIETRSG